MKPQTTIDLAPLDLRAAVGDVNDDTRTVDLTFSTGADVVRYDWMHRQRYIERLSMDPKAIRFDRLNAGAPLLDSHSAYSLANQIGVVEPAPEADGKQGRATVRFSKRAEVEPFYQDVRDKIIRNVSVGYRVYRFEETTERTQLPVRLATDWEPLRNQHGPDGRRPRRADARRPPRRAPCAPLERGAHQSVRAHCALGGPGGGRRSRPTPPAGASPLTKEQ
jgi:hypothetical protein